MMRFYCSRHHRLRVNSHVSQEGCEVRFKMRPASRTIIREPAQSLRSFGHALPRDEHVGGRTWNVKLMLHRQNICCKYHTQVQQSYHTWCGTYHTLVRQISYPGAANITPWHLGHEGKRCDPLSGSFF